MKYATKVLYTCGPYGNFMDADGFLYEELISRCRRNLFQKKNTKLYNVTLKFSIAAGIEHGLRQPSTRAQQPPVSRFRFLPRRRDSFTLRTRITRSPWPPSSPCMTSVSR